MAEGTSDKPSQQRFLLTILVLSVLQARVIAKHEPMRFRHNRIAPLYEPRRHVFSRFHYEDLMKHEYKTVQENSKVVSRFKKLDKLLNSLPRQKVGGVDAETWLEVTGPPSFQWQATTEDPRVQGVEGYREDDFLVDDLAEEQTLKIPEEGDGMNEVENDAHWSVAATSADLTTPTTSSTTTSTTPAPATSTSTVATIHNTSLAKHHHSGVSHIPVHKMSHFTTRHRKFPLSQEEINHKKEEKKSVQTHMERIKKEGGCKLPRPKVIHIKDVYPHTAKTYLPHCTILHQCGADTGCCFDERYTCRAKTTKLVTLHFYTHVDFMQKIERLDFYNHTECECQAKEDRPSNDAAVTGHAPAPLLEPTPPQPPPQPLCTCPNKFSVRYLPDGTCICDCFHLQKDCLKLKRGKDYFSSEDQLCIKTGTCLLPSCEYGHYLRKNARCVRKQEMFAYWPKYSVKDIENDKY